MRPLVREVTDRTFFSIIQKRYPMIDCLSIPWRRIPTWRGGKLKAIVSSVAKYP